MFTFTHFFTVLRAAIAAASARDRSMPGFFIELCNRVGRMGRRLEKLIAQWRAGTLPVARVRASQAGARTERAPGKHLCFPKGQGWLLGRVPNITQQIGSLELLLGEEECARFLAEVPAARKIVGVLVRMLIPAPGKPMPKMKRAVMWPPAAWQEAVRQAGMIVSPTGRLQWQ